LKVGRSHLIEPHDFPQLLIDVYPTWSYYLLD